MEPGSIRKIIHVDMDAFFASVEQRDAPDLRGRPVAVGHGERRGVVAAASYEARKFGVRSAMPSVTALRLCPDLIFVPPRFDVYKSVSASIRAIFNEYTELVEPLSLDEAYLDISANRRGLPSAWATAKAVRTAIKGSTGLTASAGVSYNKFLAKLASDQRKPDGQFAVVPGEGAAFVAALPVGRLHGVGPVTAERMHALGIHTGADLGQMPLALLKQHFGKAAGWYYGLARGEDERPVLPDRMRKSAGSETTFRDDVTEPAKVEEGVAAMAADVWAWCERAAAYGRTVTVKVKFADFQQVTRSRTATSAIATGEELTNAALSLVRGLFPMERGIRLVGVSVSGFADKSDPSQLDLGL